MRSSATSLVLALVISAIGVAGGYFLILYSVADDAPGVTILGMLLALGAVAIGVRTARRTT